MLKNKEELKKYLDNNTYLDMPITTPEESKRVRKFITQLGQPYNFILKNKSIILTKGRI